MRASNYHICTAVCGASGPSPRRYRTSPVGVPVDAGLPQHTSAAFHLTSAAMVDIWWSHLSDVPDWKSRCRICETLLVAWNWNFLDTKRWPKHISEAMVVYVWTTTGDKEESIPSTSMDTAELATGLLPMQVGITGSHDDQGYSVSSVDGVAVWRTSGVSNEVTWCSLGGTLIVMTHGSVEKIRRTKKNKHILI